VRFFFSEDRAQADYTVDVKGLSGSLVEGADLRLGGPGAEGPVVRHLAGGGFIVTGGRLQLSSSELADLIDGRYYVTLYTKDHPNGELRGQVYVPAGFVPGTTSNGNDRNFVGIPAPIAPASPAPAQPLAAAEEPRADAAPSAPPAEAPPPAFRSPIRPPNTGDGGLISGAQEPVRAAMVGVAAVIIGVGLMFASGGLSRDR
jgi:hypothetical protein